MKKSFKIKAKKILQLLIVFSIGLTSCSTDVVEELNVVSQERIDIKIDGDITDQLIQENSNLIEYTNNPTQVLNIQEKKITINLGNKNTLELTIFNQGYENPLIEDVNYNAYSLDQLDDKFGYIIGEYFNDGVKQYSSVSTIVSGNLQLDVFRIKDLGNYYLLTIDELNLYDLTDNSPSIEINGTFTLLK